MLFGDPADFAIEAELEPTLTPPSAVWGSMCIHCGDVVLGDIKERFCSLGGPADAYRWHNDNTEHLWTNQFLGLDDFALFNFLDERLYGYHGNIEITDDRSAQQLAADWSRYNKFDFLTNWGESFDGIKAFLICPPDESIRILYRSSDGARGAVSVSRLGFIAAARGFVEWHDAQDQRLKGPQP